MKKSNIALGILIVLAIIIASNLRTEITQKTSATEFVNELEKLGYYKYADEENIERLKKDFIENFDPDNELITIWDDDTEVPLDLRYYLSDAEAAYERGGFAELLDQVEPTFKEMGLTFDITDHKEEWDQENKWLNHNITVNNTEYPIFKNFKSNKKSGWNKIMVRFAQIINEEAKKQSIDERVYLVSGGNDGRIVFLTEELHEYIYGVFSNKKWKPLEVSEWMRMMNVRPAK